MIKENSLKSRGGRDLENRFSRATSLKKLKGSLKPRFINEHGQEQIIDSDFCLHLKDEMLFFDLTTSFRSDRAKQKAYNGLCCKLMCHENKCYSFYIVVPDEEANKLTKRTKRFTLKGLDGVLSFTEAVRLIGQKRC
tara:strand:- start:3579 stop:3989 length:411 start_codon:yes stop_codon:yes gene_type:complete